MALAGRLAGTVSGVLVLGALVAGCQGQRGQAPAETVGCAVHTDSRDQDAAAGGLHSTPYATASATAPEIEPEKAQPAVELALRFVPGQATTYKITADQYKSVEWKGAVEAKPEKFTDGRTGNHIELVFEQRVRQVQADGVGVLEVTIQRLKYVGEMVNKVVFDFDSARPQDVGSPLALVVGQSYQVQMSPKGQVLEISQVEPIRQAVQGGLPGHTIAARLLSDEEIRSRHEIAALSALKESSVRPGHSWSSIRTFSFDDLGGKTYERVYTLQQIGGAVPADSTDREVAGGGVHSTPYEGRMAVVEMKAIPSTALAEDSHQRPAVNPFMRMSDNTDRYEGRLVLDLDGGQVHEYTEQMQNEWIIADPAAVQTGRAAAIRMAARRLHRLERVQ
jgi:hypothetical protein